MYNYKSPFRTFSVYCTVRSFKTTVALSDKFVYVAGPIFTALKAKFERNIVVPTVAIDTLHFPDSSH